MKNRTFERIATEGQRKAEEYRMKDRKNGKKDKRERRSAYLIGTLDSSHLFEHSTQPFSLFMLIACLAFTPWGLRGEQYTVTQSCPKKHLQIPCKLKTKYGKVFPIFGVFTTVSRLLLKACLWQLWNVWFHLSVSWCQTWPRPERQIARLPGRRKKCKVLKRGKTYWGMPVE